MEEKTEKKEVNLDQNNNEELKENKKLNKQVKWVIITSVLIVVATLVSLWVVEESKKFEYNGLKFHEETLGNIKLHVSNVEGMGIFGNPINFKFILRNDPRKLNIPVNANITFLIDGNKFISLNLSSGMENCENGSIASFSLGYFLNNIGINPIPSFTENKTATEEKGLYVDCNTHPGSTVIILTAGNETAINQDIKNKDCYTLVFKNCEVMQVVEKFEIAVLTKKNN
ncbi:MAG TPA: hypothetical protein P5277_02830 [Candidatus Paceibacterota bacterium]|nr:hypothetical protein [Candidatus Paceibacterota bacterium]